MRRSAIPELAVVLLLAPAATAAQTTAASTAMHGAEASGARPVAHVCATLPAPVGSVRTTVYANLEVQEYITSDGWKRRREVARDNLALVLDDIASRVTVHPPLVTPVFATDGDRAVPVVDGEFAFTLHGDGSITHLRMLATTYAAQLDTSVVRAIEGAAAAHSLVALAGGAGDTAALRLTLAPSPDSSGVSRPLFAMQLPVYHARHAAEAIDHPPPAFPLVAWRNGVGGRVRVQFVVGSDGRPVPGTYRLLDTDYREIALAALNALSKWRFAPADLDGCAVAQTNTEEFTYSVKWMN
jgi:hypothetical protein